MCYNHTSVPTKTLTRIVGLLAVSAASGTVASLSYSRRVLLAVLEGEGLAGGELSKLTVFALATTKPAVLATLVVACLAAVVLSETTVEVEGRRLVVQLAVLIAAALLSAVVLCGLFMPFDVPDVNIG